MTLRKVFTIIILLSAALTVSAKLTISGSIYQTVSIKPEASTGLEEILVINPSAPVTVTYEASSASSSLTWQKFDNLGGGYATDVTGITKSGNNYSIPFSGEDTGYIITDNGRPHYYWVVNYSNHYADIQNISATMEEGDCDRASIIVTGNVQPVTYYSINGRAMELSREMELSYNTLEYEEGSNSYIQKNVSEYVSSSTGTIRVDAPLCDTQFTLTADRFLKTWGLEVSAVSETLTATAVSATCSATQEEKNNDNEQKVESSLGGSAPVDITFTAAITDAAIFHEWQFSHTAEFEDIFMRVTDTEFTQTFTEAGTTYIRFVAGNAAGECYYYSDVYEVMIGESALDCPNAFSPGSSEGINDEWKVSYKSIVEFECHIFNRWGIEITSFKDPSQGWDGKKGGKLVPSGVYYYVIKARGADGKKYELAGDINIINSSSSNTTTQPTE